MSLEQSPEQIAASVGMRPDRTWTMGARRGDSLLIEKENGCEYASHLPPESALDDHVHALLSRVQPIAKNIAQLGCDCVQLTCIIYSADAPYVGFSRETISALHELGASIDVDLYIVE